MSEQLEFEMQAIKQGLLTDMRSRAFTIYAPLDKTHKQYAREL